MVFLRKYFEEKRAFFKKIDRELLFRMSMLAVLILVAFSSFGLGRMSALESKKENISIEYTIDTKKVGEYALSSNTDELKEGAVVASKKGKKYHFPWCPGASQISEQNKISFASVALAEASGYTKALNCKGL